ncbi:MAG TPA: hypothetical protein VNL14_06400 [Candidatus Acidoferrales bacterium]|nr:hypothetical protein [Candidatus Acidoferrales bacterium]
MKRIYFLMAVGLFVSLALLPRAQAATLISQEKASEVVSVRGVEVKDGEVSGELVNRSGRLLRDVQLLIRYTWLWKNEFRPGKDDPGMAVYYTVDKSIPPGQSVRFSYKPASPLPSRPDGSYVISVSVAGFSEVFQ